MNEYVPKELNKNVRKTRLRKNEYQRQFEDKIAWNMTKDWSDILSKFIRASFLNQHFYNENWMKDINSISEGYKNALNSEKLSQKTDNKYINTWNTTINTLKNIHDKKHLRNKNMSSSRCSGTLNILDITSVYNSNKN